jgi:hypothetical protein
MWNWLIAPLLLTATPPFQAQTLDGRSIEGPIISATSSQVVLDTADGPVTLPTADLLALSPVEGSATPADRPAVWVELTDGTVLTGADYQSKGKNARLTLAGGDPFDFPRAAVAAVRLKSQDEAQAAQWAEIRDAKAAGDVLVIRKGEVLDYLEGTLGDATADAIQFKLDGETSNVKRARVEGLLYFRPAGGEHPEPIARMTDAGPGQIQIARFESTQTGLRIVTPANVTLDLPWERVGRLDFSAGKIVFLGELSPDAVEWTPYLSAGPISPAEQRFYQPRVDRALDGDALSLGGKTYAKGLALHSRTRMAYRLPGKFARFRATVGLDDSVQGAGAVRLLIEGDGKALFDEPVAGGDAPREVDLDLTGVKRLTILVDFGEGTDEADHLNLCDARITK